MKKKGAGKKPGDTRSTATTAATPPTAADGSTLPTIASAPGDSSTATSPAPTASPSTSTTTPTVETDAATKSAAADVTKPTAMPKATMAACPDDHLLSTSQRTKRDEMVASFLDADPSNGVDVCFSFDTTGSMYCYLEEVRAQVEETCKQLFKLIPKIRISIITHGDFCDDAEGWCVARTKRGKKTTK
ncbi:hypothetical protein Pelo_13141 [Pelomyxa schiedti]|nr:hypothetical protein Pelo_13141 [Pelomyxa schiedti]